MSVLAKVVLTHDPTFEALPTAESAARVALATESLQLHGSLRVRVRGESMLPTLWPGDVVEFSRCSLGEARPGEIVLAVRDGRFFVHRFLGPSQPNTFLLRGDSMPVADPPFAEGAFLGKLTALGREACSVSRRQWQSRLVGLLFCHCAPIRRFALKIHARRAAALAQSQAAANNAMDMRAS